MTVGLSFRRFTVEHHLKHPAFCSTHVFGTFKHRPCTLIRTYAAGTFANIRENGQVSITARFQASQQLVLFRGGDILDGRDLMEYAAGHRDNALTQGGDPHTVLAALKQRDVQLLLQFLDGNTQSRLTDVTALSGTSKVLLLR